ncbi:hypothetical protein CP10743SC13_1683, partial [Chlamydia psittaci 10_743_SC13]
MPLSWSPAALRDHG